MRSGAWDLVQEKMRETLDIYPNLKGIQVMNDMGQYMFSGYEGRWIPDTPAPTNNRFRYSAAATFHSFVP